MSEAHGAKRRRGKNLSNVLISMNKAGLKVSAVEATPQGGFRVLVSGVDSPRSVPNEWDEVLINGSH